MIFFPHESNSVSLEWHSFYGSIGYSIRKIKLTENVVMISFIKMKIKNIKCLLHIIDSFKFTKQKKSFYDYEDYN